MPQMPAKKQAVSAEISPESSGYWRLIRDNRDFRRLWLGQVISQGGDWFNLIAVFTLTQ
jgi:hypothetical protein